MNNGTHSVLPVTPLFGEVVTEENIITIDELSKHKRQNSLDIVNAKNKINAQISNGIDGIKDQISVINIENDGE